MKCVKWLWLGMLWLGSGGSAGAHPVDFVDQTHFLSISKNRVELALKLDFYPSSVLPVWASFDLNGDKKISEEEQESWLAKNTAGLWLEIEKQRYSLKPWMLELPSYENFITARHTIIVMRLHSEALPSLQNQEAFAYIDSYNNLQINQINVVVRGTEGIALRGLHTQGSRLEIQLSPQGKPFAALIHPESATKLDLQHLEASFENFSQPVSRLEHFIEEYVRSENFSWLTLFWGWLAAFLIGAFHALTPGHGKALVAGYLVGNQGTLSHAFQLGLILTITHTSSVFLLGLGAVGLSEFFITEAVMRGLSLISALLIVGLGCFLMVSRFRDWQVSQKSRSFSAVHSVLSPHGLGISHAHGGKTHVHPVFFPGEAVRFRQLVALGVSGGLVPCPDALAILLISFTIHKALLGLSFLVAFSVGLSLALIGVGASVVLAQQQIRKHTDWLERYAPWFALFSALVVTGLGLVLCWNVWTMS